MKKTIRVWLTAAVLALVLAIGLVACTTYQTSDPDETDGKGTDAATVVGTEADTTEPNDSSDSNAPADSETVAEPDDTADTADTEDTADTADTAEPGSDETGEGGDATEAPTEADTPLVLDFNALELDQLKPCFSNANQTKVSVESDENGEQYVAFATSVNNATDPFVSFNLKTYLNKAKLGNITANDFSYIIMKVRQVGCSTGTFNLYYYAGGVAGATPGMEVSSGFDVSEDDWQYILFDMRGANNWKGRVTGFRMDYMMSAVSEGEVLQLAEIQFLNSADEYYKQFDIDWNDKGFDISDEAKAEADELLNSVQGPETAYDSYEKENAANEDAGLKLWFDHMYTRAPLTGFTVKEDNISYLIQMAKNETEGCQFILAPESDVTGLKVYITDFKNASGDTLKTDLHWGYYFNVMNEMIIDPLPPVTYTPEEGMLDWVNGGNGRGEAIDNLQKYNGFDIKAGESQSFIIKATTTAESKAGEYAATLTVVDANGKEVKKATVFTYVWNFVLDDASSCKTLMDMSAYEVYMTYFDFAADLSNERGENLGEVYYNFLLDYRVNCYSLPFGNDDGSFSDSRLLEYLNNPRVQAFQPLGWSKEIAPWKVANAYNFLSQNEEWMEKAYFYPVDEPGSVTRLDDINYYGKMLEENFPGYKLIAPMHVNYATSEGDFFSYVTSSVNVWCPKTFFFNTFAEWFENQDLYYGTTVQLEEKLGSLRDRFWAEQEGGDEVWWYVTRFPNDPEITLIINTEAVNIRTLFWQQKLYNVDGFLYYLVNHWGNGSDRYWIPSADKWYQGMDAMHEINEAYPYEVYGNGILIYSGVYFAQTDPVASLRLESVRDGIEDFEYLTMLEEVYGKDVVDAIIAKWTTGLGEYSTDADAFRELRAQLGALVEKAVAAQ